MQLKWIGAMLIVISCGGTGLALAAAHKREELVLSQLRSCILYMKSQLEYRLTPLPLLFRQTGKQVTGTLRSLFYTLSREMEQQILPEAPDCMYAALRQHPELPASVRTICRDLGRSLGQLDLSGQIQGLELAGANCQRFLEELSRNREQRLRSYQTLSLCAGAALAILLI